MDTVHSITPLPSGTTSVANPPCSNDKGSVTVSGTGGTAPYVYTWMTTPVQTGPMASNLSAGTYTVSVTDANGCTGTVTATVVAPSQLLVSIPTKPPLICAGKNTVLQSVASGGTPGYTYSWYPVGGSGASATVDPMTNTEYTVVITDSKGCFVIDSISIRIDPPPVPLFSSDTSACQQLCTTFSNSTTGGIRYYWQFGDGDTSSATSPKHCYKPGDYSVTLTAFDSSGCKQSFARNNYIHVYPMPLAAFSPSPSETSILNPTVCFTNLSTGESSWKWYFLDSLNDTSMLANPCITYTSPGTYCPKLVVTTTHGCVDAVTECVTILPDVTIYVPNAFTPNGNGVNDLFLAAGTNIDPNHFEMLIFDRWGNLLWQTKEWGKGWDGRANNGNNIAQEDVYVWKIDCLDILGKRHALLGHVSLIK